MALALHSGSAKGFRLKVEGRVNANEWRKVAHEEDFKKWKQGCMNFHEMLFDGKQKERDRDGDEPRAMEKVGGKERRNWNHCGMRMAFRHQFRGGSRCKQSVHWNGPPTLKNIQQKTGNTTALPSRAPLRASGCRDLDPTRFRTTGGGESHHPAELSCWHSWQPSARALHFVVVVVFVFCFVKWCLVSFVWARCGLVYFFFSVLTTTFVEGEESALDGCAFSAARMNHR